MRRLLLFFIILLSSFCVSLNLNAQDFLINEFYRAGNLTTTDEWIEVVLINDLSSVDLEGYIIGDSQGSTSNKLGAFQFQNMASISSGCTADFPAGTIIVIGGDGALAEDTSYDPDGGDWNILLRTSGSFLNTVTAGADIAGSDVVWIDTSSSGSTLDGAGAFAVNYDSTPGTFGGNASVTITGPVNNSGVAYMSDAAGATTPSNYTSSVALGSTTLGSPNGGANTTYINGLQSALVCTVAPPSTDVPTLSQWGLIILALSFMTFGTLYILERKVEMDA